MRRDTASSAIFTTERSSGSSPSLALRIAQKELQDGRVTAVAEGLETIGAELDEALADLRDLARGIHPAVLTERGPPDALETLALRSLVPVEIEQAPKERFNAQVEATVYYVVAEALTNVAKYAEARVASVRVIRRNSRSSRRSRTTGSAAPTRQTVPAYAGFPIESRRWTES